MNSYSVHNRKGGWLKVFVFVVVFMIVLAVGAVVFMRKQYDSNLQPVSTNQQLQTVTVESGATVRDVAVELKEKGLIRSTWAFEWYIRTNGLRDKIQAGSYDVTPAQSVAEIVGNMTNGKVSSHLVTILPAQRLDQIKQAFVKSGFVAADVERAFRPDQYKTHAALADKPANASLEGYLYPDSFQKTANTKPEEIVKQSLDVMQQHMTTEIRAGFVKHGLTAHQGVVLASIVEKEVSNPADRPMVAQVFLKRLKNNMTLGSDVTALYGAIVAGQAEPAVTYDSPYNTRLHEGLPPGPISNVSENAMRAVAFPASTDYLYFVAGDDGVTHFTKTLEEHNAATQQYCKKLCE